MPYSQELAKLTREPFNIVEFGFDNTLSASGFERHCDGLSPIGEEMHSTIESEKGIRITPVQIETPGFGLRGHSVITLRDFNHGAQGTYWGKIIARNPYYLDRPLRIYKGFYDGGNDSFDWANFKEHLYFIKSIDGPDANGKVTVRAADPLTFLEGDQASVPNETDGKLLSDLAKGVTGTRNIGDNTGFNAAGGICIVNSEYIRYSGLSGSDSIVITERNVFGTEEDDHEAGDAIQDCFYFEDENVVDVIRRLFEEQSPVDHAAYIPDAEWDFQRDTYLPGQNMSGVITPTKNTKDEVDKLAELGHISVWWSETEQKLKLEAIGPTISPEVSLNKTDHILKEGEDVKRNPNKAITQVRFYYGIRNPEEDDQDPLNYQQVHANPDAEAIAGFGKVKIKRVWGKYVPASGLSTASRVASRILSQSRQGDTYYHFMVDPKDSEVLPGNRIAVQTDRLQDEDGAQPINNFMVVSRNEKTQSRYQYKAIKTGFLASSNFRKIAPNSMPDYLSATPEQRAEYAFIADSTTEEMSNGDDPTRIL